MMRKGLNRIASLFSAIIICCIIPTGVFASAGDTKTYIHQIVHPINEQQRTVAINLLVEKKDPTSLPFLCAISNSALYVWKGIVVTSIVSPSAKDNRVTVYRLYPNLMLINKDGRQVLVNREALEQITISRADRLLLTPISPQLALFNPNPQMRTMAYRQYICKSLQDKEFLSYALKREKDSNALRAGEETMLAYQLHLNPKPQLARQLIDAIYDNNGESAARILKEYGKTNRPASAYAKERAASLESSYARLQKIQNIFSGISLGSILILISLGLGIIYGLAGVINMAHGEFLMIGAYATFTTQLIFNNILKIESSDWFFLTALPISFLVAGVGGLLLEKLIVRHLYAKPLESLLATWGVSLILIQLARWIFGDMTAVKLPDMLSGGLMINPRLVLPYNRLFIIGLTFTTVIAVYWLLMRTRLGLQIRAVTQNRNMSACLGIDTKRVNAITFFMGSGLAGLAGCAMTLIGNVVPDMGQTYIVDSFLMVVVGGVGKLIGIIVSGLGIGVSSKILEALFEAVYGKVLILLAIMVFMQFKPKGLFPDRGRSAED